MRFRTLKSNPPLFGWMSLLVPGLGQVLNHQFKRGVYVFLTVCTALVIAIWHGDPIWFVPAALLWVWNLIDSLRSPVGAPIAVAAILWFGVAFGIGWQVTDIHPLAFITNTDRARSLLKPMLEPDFFARRQEKREAWLDIETPCSPQPPKGQNVVDGIQIAVSPDCATVGQSLQLTVSGLWSDNPVEVAWSNPIGSVSMLLSFTSDSTGKLDETFIVSPNVLSAAPDPTKPLIHRLWLRQYKDLGGFEVSQNGKYIFQGILETLALALLSTTLGAILALPFGLLAARNLMSANPLTTGIYLVTRTSLNILRSVEALIMAIIFVVIVGLGPFPGMIALTLHTTAALGKLFSEVIEGIDPGPIEAIRSTGASWIQTIRYAVIPQVVMPFTALTVYRWDINVRSSTIIGFVGGGGIGFFLYQWILIQEFRAVSSAFIAIAIVVIILDFFSAQLRQRLV